MAERRRPERRRFDILEYQATVQDATVLVQELTPVLAALDVDGNGGQPVTETARGLECARDD